jgi:hypothetical protein
VSANPATDRLPPLVALCDRKVSTPQSKINRAHRRAELRAQMQIAGSVATALLLAGLIIGGYSMLLQATNALPDLMAEAAARQAW